MTQGSCPPFPLVFMPFFLRRGLPPSKFSTPSHFPPLPPSPIRLQACLLSVPAPNAKFPRSAPDHFTSLLFSYLITALSTSLLSSYLITSRGSYRFISSVSLLPSRTSPLSSSDWAHKALARPPSSFPTSPHSFPPSLTSLTCPSLFPPFPSHSTFPPLPA